MESKSAETKKGNTEMTAAETEAKAKLTWTERYRRDPDLAQSIVETLQRSLAEEHARADRLELALEQIRDGNWKYTFATPSRDYWMQQIAREALECS